MICTAIIVLFHFITGICFCQPIGIGTNTPDASAQLDVYSDNKGLLTPRVALAAVNVAAPVSNPATGLVVYNTASAGSAPFNVAPGFYFWNGTAWYPMLNKGTTPGEMQYWDGSKWIMIPPGQEGQHLVWCNGKPVWGGCPPQLLTVAPVNNAYEQYYYSYFPNAANAGSNAIPAAAWTNSGQSSNLRSCIKFDFSGIAPTAVIDSAILYLYADPTPDNGNLVDAMFGQNNACYIRRITSPWVLPTYFTWVNQPVTTTTNQAVIPQSNGAFENSIINVTNLVKDMRTFGNNGFQIELQTEVIYNSRQYASSFDAGNAALRPKLMIYFH
jgi:hypothetical protein